MDKDSDMIDSQYEPSEVILQNPERPCPSEILESLGLLDVRYLSFDGKLHQGQIVVAIDVMSEVEAFFQQALEHGFPIERVVPVSAPAYRWNSEKALANNLSSGFDYRKVATQDKVSMHSFGRAFDVNPRQNPYIRYEKGTKILHVPKGVHWDISESGTLYATHPLVKLMEGFGWTWGGNWKPASGRVDYMHFEKPLA